ncbi:MAG: esterase [Gemmatimonadetes bacterium]|nr:MAG: esterase [Gemmatimonadota bacterium]
MNREIHQWWSDNLDKEMPLIAYGHYGFALLMFPTAAFNCYEYEERGMIHRLAPWIEAGKIKVYVIDSINNESWMNPHLHPRDKAIRHQQYNRYVTDEVVPFIYAHCGGNEVPIITTGASLGAFHAANTVFRRPDLFDGMIAMSGSYDVKLYTDGYYDDNCYYNSPIDYLPNLEGDHLAKLQTKTHLYILTGQGAYEHSQWSIDLSAVLKAKHIPHELDIWGYDMPHDWPTWFQMLPYYIDSRF